MAGLSNNWTGFYVVSLRSRWIRWVGLALALGFIWRVFTAGVARPAVAQPPAFPVYRVQTHAKMMALMVNVVWGTPFVAHMLAILRQHHVVATFMLGGAWAEAHPTLVRELRAAGNELGNHGWSHRHPDGLSWSQNVDDIARTNRAIEAIAGVRPAVYAPPYGEFAPHVVRAANTLGMPLIMWTIDTIDWRPSTTAIQMTRKILARAAPGAIVLMHPTDRTVQALPHIIQGLTHAGYQLVTVSTLLAHGTPKSDA